MSKKKSYMDKKNILSEDIISSFFKGLFKGMKQGIFGKKTKSSEQDKKELQNYLKLIKVGHLGLSRPDYS